MFIIKAIIIYVLFLSTLAYADTTGGFTLKTGIYSPSENSLNDSIGKGALFGVSYRIAVSDKLSLEPGLEYVRNRSSSSHTELGFRYDIEDSYEIVPITLTLRYQQCMGKNCPYGGVGIGYYLFTIKNELKFSDFHSTGEAKDKEIGFHLLLGYERQVFNSGYFLVEASFRRVPSSELKWKYDNGTSRVERNYDLGGLSASLGYRFCF